MGKVSWFLICTLPYLQIRTFSPIYIFSMLLRNKIGILLTIVSVGMLFPGIFQAAFTLKAEISIPFLGKQEVYSETRSVVAAIQSLSKNGNYFPAGLIFLFGIIVPLLKAFGMAIVVAFPSWPRRKNWLRFVKRISKWAMADVFAVSLVLALLVVKSNDIFTGSLQSGFYWFAGYVIVSTAAAQCMKIETND